MVNVALDYFLLIAWGFFGVLQIVRRLAEYTRQLELLKLQQPNHPRLLSIRI